MTDFPSCQTDNNLIKQFVITLASHTSSTFTGVKTIASPPKTERKIKEKNSAFGSAHLLSRGPVIQNSEQQTIGVPRQHESPDQASAGIETQEHVLTDKQDIGPSSRKDTCLSATISMRNDRKGSEG